MKRATKVLATILLLFISTTVSLEAAGIAYAYIVEGRFFYARSTPAAVPTWRSTIHPFWGHATVPDNDANKDVIYDDMAISHAPSFGQVVHPIERKKDEIIIGIFGGSVAASLGYWAEHNPRGFNDLIAAEFPGKTVRTINFAVVGQKQPSTANILTYFLALGQEFDLVINVDGFNDAVISASNAEKGIHYSWPAPAWARAINKIAEPDLSGIGAKCPIAACYAVAKIAAVTAGSLIRLFNVPSANMMLVPRNRGSENDIISYWLKASQLMEAMAKSQGIKYLHVLQPNQWFRRSAPYGGVKENHSYDFVPVFYPKMIEAAKASGENFFDATAALDAYGDEVYSDTCCHLTEEGREQVLKVLVPHAVDALQR